MVKVHLISYANGKFIKNQNRLNKSAKKYGIKNITSYNNSDLKRTKFYSKYKNILDKPRGAGYWLWKPFFIYKTLNEMREGDILIYSDAGAVFVSNPLPLLKLASKEGILLFTNNEVNIKWNKAYCLSKMNCNSEKGFYSLHVSAGFQIYVNNERTRMFVKEWLYYCRMPNLIDDTAIGKEYAAFKEHRHDQSILTNVAIKHNIPLYRDPSQGGNHLKPREFRKRGEWLQYPYEYKNDIKLLLPSDSKRFKYPTVINHLRNTGKIKLLLIRIHTKLPKWIKKITKRH